MPKTVIPKMNSKLDFELNDGSIVPLTITWGLLMQIRSKSLSDYKRFSKMVAGGVGDDILGCITILYAAYLCGHIDEHGGTVGCMAESDFIDAVPNNYRLVMETTQKLLDPK